MKTKLKLTESDLHNIVKNVINESLNTLRLQLINGYFYPTDSISSEILKNELNLGRIPEERIDVISPQLVKRGYKLALFDYYPTPTNREPISRGAKIGGEAKPQKDPCMKCSVRDLCDPSDCGRKGFRLFTK